MTNCREVDQMATPQSGSRPGYEMVDEGMSREQDIPPAPRSRLQPDAHVLVRERLLRRLSDATTPLVVVHGPAGSGKTLLVAAWVDSGQVRAPVGWVSLDSDAAAPGPFWAGVVQALRRCGVPLGSDVGIPAEADVIDPSFLARVAAAVNELDEDVVLVLDEFDAVSGGPVAAELASVLRLAAPHLRVVLIGRRLRRFGLARHRAAGAVTEIGPVELAFTPEETDQLFALHGVVLTAEVRESLRSWTEGWATALRLSALAIGRGTEPEQVTGMLAGGLGHTTDFLLTEVVDDLPAETQDLLLRTCLLDTVDADLADLLTGRSGSRHILNELATDLAFVRTAPGQNYFRYHQLLADALRARLRRLAPESEERLHRQSAQWFADRGRLTEAVVHALAVGDWSLAAGHVVDDLAVGHLLVGLDKQRLATLFADLPPEDRTPEVSLVRAAGAMAKFDAASCLDALNDAVAGAPQVPEPRRSALRLGVATVRLIVSRLTNDIESGERAGREAVSLLSRVDPSRLERHPELPALVLSSLGTLELWNGDLGSAEDTLRAGTRTASGPGSELSRTNCMGQLAVVHYLRGHLHMARRFALDALELADRSGISPVSRVAVGHLAAAAVGWEWDDLAAMGMHLQDAGASLAVRHDASLAALLALLRARRLTAEGAAREAARTLEDLDERLARLPPASFVSPLLVLERSAAALTAGDSGTAAATLELLPADSPEHRYGLARLLLADRRPADALVVLGDDASRRELAPSLRIRALLLEAEACLGTGGSAPPEELLKLALQRARPEGFRRAFVEARHWIPGLLHSSPDLRSSYSWVGSEGASVTHLGPPHADDAGLLVETLTKREYEMLQMAATPMTNREIAAAMHVSVNTVKTHLSGAFRKLAAQSRNDAIRRARRQGLI
jgi:LuxR family maltose regulon positive regulatory protein